METERRQEETLMLRQAVLPKLQIAALYDDASAGIQLWLSVLPLGIISGVSSSRTSTQLSGRALGKRTILSM